MGNEKMQRNSKDIKLSISEVFYSIQGEGKTMGYPAVFVRLAGCNLMCGGAGTQFDKQLHNGATWRCDTIEVWMKGRAKKIEDILDDECKTAIENGAHLIITGGEPAMQQDNVVEFIKYVKTINKYVFVECETNGTMSIEKLKKHVHQFNCSPKLSNSGNPREMRINENAIKELAEQNTMFKFVVSRLKDWEEIKNDFLPLIYKHQIWFMPAGSTQDELSKTSKLVAEICKHNYIKYSTRLQVDIWNETTGV